MALVFDDFLKFTRTTPTWASISCLCDWAESMSQWFLIALCLWNGAWRTNICPPFSRLLGKKRQWETFDNNNRVVYTAFFVLIVYTGLLCVKRSREHSCAHKDSQVPHARTQNDTQTSYFLPQFSVFSEDEKLLSSFLSSGIHLSVIFLSLNSLKLSHSVNDLWRIFCICWCDTHLLPNPKLWCTGRQFPPASFFPSAWTLRLESGLLQAEWKMNCCSHSVCLLISQFRVRFPSFWESVLVSTPLFSECVHHTLMTFGSGCMGRHVHGVGVV